MVIKCNLCGTINNWLERSHYFIDLNEQLLLHLKTRHYPEYQTMLTNFFTVVDEPSHYPRETKSDHS